jgi:uncharacterized small protein (DUF1192 family)
LAKINCWDCGGSGKKEYYAHIDGGICYTCLGSGVWNDVLTLTATQEERKRIAQAIRDMYEIARLYAELEQLKKELTSIAAEYKGCITTGYKPQKALDDKAAAICAGIKRVTLAGAALQMRVTDVEYKPFKEAYLIYDEAER